MTELGPVQLLVVGFDDPASAEHVLVELARLREHDVVRVLDLLVVRKGDDARAERIAHDRLDELAIDGAALAALLGLGAEEDDRAAAQALVEVQDALAEDDFWYLEDAIPDGAVAAVALVEHRWAVPLGGAIDAAGGAHLVDAWVHPVDLAAAGLGPPEARS